MKAYNKKVDIGDFFKVLVEVPNVKPELEWKAPQIQKIKLNFTNQPLTLRFRSLKATSGLINISKTIINPDTLAVTFN